MKSTTVKIFLFFLIHVIAGQFVFSQSNWPAMSWDNAQNLTPVISSSGIAELSGLYWNDDLKRLYLVENKGSMRVLQYNQSSGKYSLIANISNLDSPEGITQINNANQEFYTINESSYEIRKYSHDALFANCKLQNSWNLLNPPSTMEETDNDGPEGIAFVPDAFLTAAGFISSVTGNAYVSTKGMGGLFFIAHQKKGLIWVFDVNPGLSNDFAFVGKYQTNRKESCDLTFDQSTGLMYVLHNIDDNYLELSNLKTTVSSGNYKFNIVNEFYIPNPSDGNENIEGFAISSVCSDSSDVSVWLCRDIDTDESNSLKKDCLRWFKPFTSNVTCKMKTGNPEIVNSALCVFDPVSGMLRVSMQDTDKRIVLNIYDMTGNLKHLQMISSAVEYINIDAFNKGIYLISIQVESSIVFSEKIIKF